jgi:hypothetical protein
MFPGLPPKKKKKVDYEALQSPLNRIPGLDLLTVRDLIDCGFRHIHDLAGRSPEAIFEEIQNRRENTPADRIGAIRLAVYFAETPDPDPRRLQPHLWLH